MPFKKVPIKALTQEDGAADLVQSERMKPYLKFALAKQKQAGLDEALATIKDLPLEERYVWRIASALKWAFADCDADSAEADRLTMKPEDFDKISDLIHIRPIQFCIILKALFWKRGDGRCDQKGGRRRAIPNLNPGGILMP